MPYYSTGAFWAVFSLRGVFPIPFPARITPQLTQLSAPPPLRSLRWYHQLVGTAPLIPTNVASYNTRAWREHFSRLLPTFFSILQQGSVAGMVRVKLLPFAERCRIQMLSGTMLELLNLARERIRHSLPTAPGAPPMHRLRTSLSHTRMLQLFAANLKQ